MAARPAESQGVGALAARLIRCPEASRDVVSGVLWAAGTLGLEERPTGEIIAYFAGVPGALVKQLRSAGATEVRSLPVVSTDWVTLSRRKQGAVRLPGLVIRPPWSRARGDKGGAVLVIDPARAFGTGSHESTRLILGELLRCPPLGQRVLDIGSGSGILALTARLLGASAAVALDIDEEAVRAVRENARRNLLGSVMVVRGGPACVRGEFALVVANLTGVLLMQNGLAIAARVRRRGALIVAGLLAREAAAVESCFAGCGLVLSRRLAEGEWMALCFSRVPLRTRH